MSCRWRWVPRAIRIKADTLPNEPFAVPRLGSLDCWFGNIVAEAFSAEGSSIARSPSQRREAPEPKAGFRFRAGGGDVCKVLAFLNPRFFAFPESQALPISVQIGGLRQPAEQAAILCVDSRAPLAHVGPDAVRSDAGEGGSEFRLTLFPPGSKSGNQRLGVGSVLQACSVMLFARCSPLFGQGVSPQAL